MYQKFTRPVLAVSVLSALLLTGCAATTSESGGTSSAAKATESPARELSPIEKVREADPDKLGEHLAYKSVGQNANGKYVVLGADTGSDLSKFSQKIWTSTGSNWAEGEMAQMQLMAIDFLYDSMLSGPATAGGNKADHDRQADSIARLFSRESGNQDQIRELFTKSDSENPFTASTDPASAFFEGYEIYQNAGSSRYLNPSVSIVDARSYNKSSDLADGSKSEIDGATITVTVAFDLKLTKGDKTFTKPGKLEYDLLFVKRQDGIHHHGLESTGGDLSAEPVEAKF